MARGGYRPGAGRPKGSKSQPKALATEATPPSDKKKVRSRRRTPLEYMLDVMNDEAASDSRRDHMAIAAAPFCHGKIADKTKGKRAAQQEAAQRTSDTGGGWGDDLKSAPGAVLGARAKPN